MNANKISKNIFKMIISCGSEAVEKHSDTLLPGNKLLCGGQGGGGHLQFIFKP